MYYNTKSLPEILENLVLRDLYIRRHEIFESQERARRKQIFDQFKTYYIEPIIAFSKGIAKVAGICTVLTSLIGAGLLFLPDRKDASELLDSEFRVVQPILRQAEYQINRGNLNKAKRLYQEAINSIPDNSLTANYKKNLEREMNTLSH